MNVTSDISMSLDGFMTGVSRPLGEGGERLHQWVYELASWRERHGLGGGKTSRDAEVLDEAFKDVGAFVMGKRMFRHGEKPWGDDPPFHAPVFVVTHEARKPLAKAGGTTFTFVTDGAESALEQAKAAASGKDVSVAGGANIVQQFLKAGLLDKIQIHLVPIVLGAGRKLFEHLHRMELEPSRVIASSGVTHLRYRVKGKGDRHG